ncbi:protein of unknown function [Candidatus Filomicrobium marinum]|uniref:Uncharacterized protein n=1 Tax=Candidatus Filomicrobium marinum TaxID=1608628 RepID=A0A0D6JHE8_9HYPH|nr:protein of unknown function [Candidatus Filomicrobium marinum]CPR20862.1 protein of unknown function [Candidatus Filomicrobium marinum]
MRISLGSYSSASIVRRPALRINPANPFQKIDEIVELLIVQFEVGHLPTTFDAARLRLHPSDEGIASPLSVVATAIAHPDIAEFGREISTLAKKRVAVDARVFLPDMLTPRDIGVERVGVAAGVDDKNVAVDCQSHEKHEEENRAAIKNVASRSLGKAFAHETAPIAEIKTAFPLLTD